MSMATVSKKFRRRRANGTKVLLRQQPLPSARQKPRRPRRRQQLVLRSRGPVVVGRGGYLSNALPYAPQIGAGLGGMIGGPMGALAGGAIGSFVDTVFGKGDYQVRTNTVLRPVPMGQPIPMFASLENATIITHSEYLGDVVEPGGNNGAFLNRTYPINAGLSGTFPWLSALAANYDQYLFSGLLFQFRSSSSVINNAAGAGLGLGMVILSTNYDSVQSPYATKTEMENAQYTISGRPSDTLTHPIECDRSITPISLLYSRFTDVPGGQDQRLYDLGIFQVATQGVPANANAQTLGELWATYQVALVKPQLNSGSAGFTITSWKWQLPIATVSSGGGAYFGNPASAAILVGGSSPNPPTLSNAGVITFPLGIQGSFQVTYSIYGASTTLTTAIAWTNGTNVSSAQLFNNDTFSDLHVTAGAVATTQVSVKNITITAPAVATTTLTLSAGTVPGTFTGADLWIQQVNTAIVS